MQAQREVTETFWELARRMDERGNEMWREMRVMGTDEVGILVREMQAGMRIVGEGASEQVRVNLGLADVALRIPEGAG
jgi:hypothetical protein